MLELQVELPRERKIIEWDKASPTFCEIKERLGNCGVAKGWCVEILREGEYVSPDDDMRLKDCKKLTVRASPIAERVPVGEGPSTAFAPGWSLNTVYLTFDSQDCISNWWWLHPVCSPFLENCSYPSLQKCRDFLSPIHFLIIVHTPPYRNSWDSG